MANPLASVAPFLELLGKELKILPATGGAVEDLQRPEQEEVEDALINKDTKEVTSFAEQPEPDISNIYRSTPPIPRQQKHMFKYFIDGSIRTYFLATGIEGTRSFPIELAQIGAAVVQREDNGRITVHNRSRQQKLLLLLPKQNLGVSDTLWQQLQWIQKPEFLELVDFTLLIPLAMLRGTLGTRLERRLGLRCTA